MFVQFASKCLTELVIRVVPRLIANCPPGRVQNCHTAWEESLSARIGLIRLECNHAFVLDHSDTYLGLQIPTLRRSHCRWYRGHLNIGYCACQGKEQVRQSGFFCLWIRPFPSSILDRRAIVDDIPF